MSLSRRTFLTGLLAISVFSASTQAWADRPPTAEERERIEAALRAAGFQTWEEIELENGVWEVDDARAADGRKYDLKLDPNSLQIIHQEKD